MASGPPVMIGLELPDVDVWSGRVAVALGQKPWMFTGPGTNTYLVGYGDLGLDEWCNHNMHFGVREHAMGNIVNGLALHGGVIPYGATFLSFSDDRRPALRLAALARHGVQIMSAPLHGHHDGVAIHSLDGDVIHDERLFGDHRVSVVSEIGSRQDLHQFG